LFHNNLIYLQLHLQNLFLFSSAIWSEMSNNNKISIRYVKPSKLLSSIIFLIGDFTLRLYSKPEKKMIYYANTNSLYIYIYYVTYCYCVLVWERKRILRRRCPLKGSPGYHVLRSNMHMTCTFGLRQCVNSITLVCVCESRCP